MSSFPDVNIIPAADLPQRPAGPNDSLVGVDRTRNQLAGFSISSIPVPAAVTKQINDLVAGQQTSAIYANTLADLQAVVGTFDGQGAMVANGAEAGQYRWSSTGASWQFLRADSLASKAEKSEVIEVQRAFEGTGQAGLGVYDALDQVTQLIRDTSGRLRVIMLVDRDRAISYLDANGVTAEGAQQALSYSGAEQVFNDLGPAYPAHGRYFRDVNGRLRVQEARGNGYDFMAGSESPAPMPTTWMLVLAIGQSNMRGSGDASLSSKVPAGVAKWWDSSTSTFREMVDPVDDAMTGSCIPAFCLEVWKRTGQGVIVVPCARGSAAVTQAASTGAGQGVNNWSATGALRAQAATKLAAASAAADAAGLCWQFGGTIFAGGETDGGQIDAGAAGLDQAAFKAGLLDLIVWTRATTGSPRAPFVIARTGRRRAEDTAGFQQVRAVQMQLPRDDSHVFVGFTGAVSFAGRGLMVDDLHYLQPAYNEMGKSLGAAISVLGVGRN